MRKKKLYSVSYSSSDEFSSNSSDEFVPSLYKYDSARDSGNEIKEVAKLVGLSTALTGAVFAMAGTVLVGFDAATNVVEFDSFKKDVSKATHNFKEKAKKAIKGITHTAKAQEAPLADQVIDLRQAGGNQNELAIITQAIDAQIKERDRKYIIIFDDINEEQLKAVVTHYFKSNLKLEFNLDHNQKKIGAKCIKDLLKIIGQSRTENDRIIGMYIPWNVEERRIKYKEQINSITLSFEGHNIGDRGIKKIRKTLSKAKCLYPDNLVVNLKNNKISEKASVKLQKETSLSSNKPLTIITHSAAAKVEEKVAPKEPVVSQSQSSVSSQLASSQSIARAQTVEIKTSTTKTTTTTTTSAHREQNLFSTKFKPNAQLSNISLQTQPTSAASSLALIDLKKINKPKK